jgi:hypothetical protein
MLEPVEMLLGLRPRSIFALFLRKSTIFRPEGAEAEFEGQAELYAATGQIIQRVRIQNEQFGF